MSTNRMSLRRLLKMSKQQLLISLVMSWVLRNYSDWVETTGIRCLSRRLPLSLSGLHFQCRTVLLHLDVLLAELVVELLLAIHCLSKFFLSGPSSSCCWLAMAICKGVPTQRQMASAVMISWYRVKRDMQSATEMLHAI